MDAECRQCWIFRSGRRKIVVVETPQQLTDLIDSSSVAYALSLGALAVLPISHLNKICLILTSGNIEHLNDGLSRLRAIIFAEIEGMQHYLNCLIRHRIRVVNFGASKITLSESGFQTITLCNVH